MILKFRVYEQTISLQSTKSEPRQGSKDYLELQFSFSSDWNDLLKYVYLQHGEVSVPHDLVEESIIVDEYFTEQTEFNVTLLGKSADGSVEVPTNVVTVFLKESNNLWVKDAPEPQNSWFVQVVDARDEALAAAIRAENAAIHQPYPNSETGTWWVWSAETGKYEDTGESYGVGGGTSDHTELSNRDAADQHPMSAITGLEDALDSKQPTGNYLTEEHDPTVPEWAKQPKKPAYTAQEVGALPDTTHIPSTAADVNAEPYGAVAQHNVSDAAHSDIRLLIQGLSERLSVLADSDDTTLDQLSEIVAYIKSNRDLIFAITTDKVSVADIVDNLTTDTSNKPLSAAQGVALKELIDALSNSMTAYRTAAAQDVIDSGKVDKVVGKGLSSNDYTDVAKAKVDALAPVATSGSYNDLTDKPTIPDAVTEGTVSGWGFTKNTGTYSKPTGGIPKADLANDVKASLGKADTALQEHQSLAAYRTAVEQNIIDNGKQDKITSTNKLAYSLISDTPTIPTVPTNISAFTNDAGYLTLATLPKYEGVVE